MLEKRAEARSISEAARNRKEQLIAICEQHGRFLVRDTKGNLKVAFVQEREVVKMDRVGLAARLGVKRSTLTTQKIAEYAKKGKLTPELVAEYETHDTIVVLRTKKPTKTEIAEFKEKGLFPEG
jgi:endo-alpha-1,4-polygalactosaminidase (GH114 family)